MNSRSHPVKARIAGPLALFTRPEMKVERVSYEVITPSAARGVLSAVLWKPEMRWEVRRITVLNPIRFLSIKRNEIATKVPASFSRWARENRPDRDFFADDDRQQRNSVLLREVDYLVEATIELTDRAGPDDPVQKYVEIFERRLAKGQCFQQPYLGCREFPATFASANGDERAADELRGHEIDLGWMLHDIDFETRPFQPRFFHAVMSDGVVAVPPWRREVAA
ncbi:MAG: type I-C CRISPR-associated protein Cas5c [Chloroflexota bacterium]|nr:type I-C CRISPR-associated protein Cas5c [Chloroflexota bacterium]